MKLNPPITLLALIFTFFAASTASAQEASASHEHPIYKQIKAFALTGGAVDVKNLELKRDRLQLTLNGVVYLSEPVNGQVTGAVFIGDGNIVVETPPSDFEKDNLKRLLGTDTITSDFKTAVFRFTDDTAKQLGQPRVSGAVDERAQKLAREIDNRIMRETGANLPARLAISLMNMEKPGFFFAQFDGGKRGRFSAILDHQNRIPVANFRINAGEKGLIWSYDSDIFYTKVWLAFYVLEDYQRGTVAYSDANDQIDVKSYRIDGDLRDYKDRLRLNAVIEAEP